MKNKPLYQPTLILATLLLGIALFPSYAQEPTDQLRIDAATLDAEGRGLGAASEAGAMAEIFRLQKALVYQLLRQIGLTPDKLSPEVRAAIDRFQTTNLKAFATFSLCLDFLDKEEFARARAACIEAAQLDPNFDMARRLRDAIPETKQAIAEISEADMREALTQIMVAVLATPAEEEIPAPEVALQPTTPPVFYPEEIANYVSDQEGERIQQEAIDISAPPCEGRGRCGYYSTFLARQAVGGDGREESRFFYLNGRAVALNPGGSITIAQQGNLGFLRLELDSSGEATRLRGFLDGFFGQGNESIEVPLDRLVVTEYPGLQLGVYLTGFEFAGRWQNDQGTHEYDFFHGFAYFAEGQPTSPEAIASLAQDNAVFGYQGTAGADFSVNGELVSCLACGSFSSTLDYGAGKVRDFKLDIDAGGAAARIRANEVGLSNLGQFQFDTSGGQFAVGRSLNELLSANAGMVAGGAFGSAAESVGGVFAIQGITRDGASILGAGNFGGQR